MTPEEYNSQVEALARRRAVANAMLSQSLGASSSWGQDRYKHSPWEAVANLGSTYLNSQTAKGLDKESKTLTSNRQAEIAAALSKYQGSQQPADFQSLASTSLGPEEMAKATVSQAMAPEKLQEVAPGASLFSPRQNKTIFTNPKEKDPEKPMDELAKLNEDLKMGRISQKDYEARKVLMTTRPPQLGAIGPTEDANIDAIGKATANYQLAPPAGGNRSPRGAAILAAALKYNPNYQAEEFGSRTKAYKDFATGKQGEAVKSFNVGISHLNTAGDLADALGNGDVRILNKISQAWAEETGSPAPTNLDTAKEVIKAEIVKAISGAGGGVADRERALAGIDKAASPAQLHGAIETAKKLMGGQLGGLKRQFEHATGRADFENMLSPDALPYLSTKEATGSETTGKTGKIDPAIEALVEKYRTKK